MSLPPDSSQILLQYPLLGIMVILTMVFLWYMREERKDARAERKEERESRESEQSKLRDFMAVQNELFLAGVKEIRDQGNVSLGRLADELKTTNERISGLHSIVTAHDAASRERSTIPRSR
jgi:hypothetical protein